MKKPAFTLVFLVFVVADLLSIALAPGVRAFTKPLIMISLIVYTWSQRPNDGLTQTGRIFSVALFFALLGDIFLLFDGLFVFGLLSFLIMQVGYILCFFMDKTQWGWREKIFGLLLGALVITIIKMLWPLLGHMKIPVVIYSFTLALMALTAFARDNIMPGYWTVFIGAICFIISDSLLSFNQFFPESPFGGWTVMSTYALAQYLIVIGFTDSWKFRTS